MLATKIEVYVDGARALGATIPRVVLAHILPNTATPVLVQASMLMAIGILVEAALSFLGVGVRPPTPSLGLMLADGRGFMLQAPWMVIFPGPCDHARRARLQYARRRPARLGRPAARSLHDVESARARGVRHS